MRWVKKENLSRVLSPDFIFAAHVVNVRSPRFEERVSVRYQLASFSMVGRDVIEHLVTSFLPRVPIHCIPCGIVGGNWENVTVSIRMVPFSLLSIISTLLNILSSILFGQWFFVVAVFSYHTSNENIPVLYIISWKSRAASLVHVWVLVGSSPLCRQWTPTMKFLHWSFYLFSFCQYPLTRSCFGQTLLSLKSVE